MTADRREVLRYLGYGGHAADEAVTVLIAECENELSEAATPRFVSQMLLLRRLMDGRLECGFFRTDSKKLSKTLGGCGQVLVMAATLGAGVDRLLARYGRLSLTKAVVMQATAAALMEAYCNELCTGWREEYERKGLYLRPRFSPGYGDFPLSCQEGLLNGLQAGKRIGITLTEGSLMMPSKSVTAVIGISENKEFCTVTGCEICEKTDCAYRR